MPPRHGKTELISHWTPAWFLANFPELHVGLATYNSDFALSLGRRVRDTIDATPELGIEVRGDMRGAGLFGLTAGGYMMSTGIGGPMTGHGFHLLIVDDPIKNRRDASSPTTRQQMWEWWTSTARSRLEPDGSIVVLMTRWHEDDIIGRMMNDEFGEGYESIVLPAIAEDENDALGRQVGEALWPARYNEVALENVRNTIGPYDWAGLYQQRPAPRKGGYFESEWFDVVDAVPPGGRTVRGWDLAATAGGGDYTAACKMTLVDGVYYIVDIWRDRLSAADVERRMKALASQDTPRVLQDIPQDPGQAGKMQARYLVKQLAGYNVKFSTESGSKEHRAGPVSAQAEIGNIKLLRGKWNRHWREEAASFPFGTFDDQVDAVSRAFHRLTGVSTQTTGLPEYVNIEAP